MINAQFGCDLQRVVWRSCVTPAYRHRQAQVPPSAPAGSHSTTQPFPFMKAVATAFMKSRPRGSKKIQWTHTWRMLCALCAISSRVPTSAGSQLLSTTTAGCWDQQHASAVQPQTHRGIYQGLPEPGCRTSCQDSPDLLPLYQSNIRTRFQSLGPAEQDKRAEPDN